MDSRPVRAARCETIYVRWTCLFKVRAVTDDGIRWGALNDGAVKAVRGPFGVEKRTRQRVESHGAAAGPDEQRGSAECQNTDAAVLLLYHRTDATDM